MVKLGDGQIVFFIDVPNQIPVGNTFPQLTAGDTVLNISYSTSAEGLLDVTLFYRVKGDVNWIENGTFPSTGTLQISALTNGTTYEVYLQGNPNSLDYVTSQSNILEDTPTASVRAIKCTSFGFVFSDHTD